MKRISMLIILLMGLYSNCTESPTDPGNPDLNLETSKVFIVNQGIWGGANGSLSIYDIENDTLYNNAMELGNVANHMIIENNKGYVINSTSNNLMVLDLSGKEIVLLTIIDGLNNPWASAILQNKLYITNQLGNNVTVVDLEQNTSTGVIDVGTAPQGIYSLGDKIYVANTGFAGYGNPYLSGKISVITGNQVTKQITVGINPQNFTSDSDENLYVLCAGDYGATSQGKVYKINTSNDSVADSLDIQGAPNFIVNDGNDNFYILGFMFAFHKVNFAQKTVTQISDKTGTCLAVDREGNVYLGESSADFISPGKVYMYDSQLNLTKTIEVGIGPSSISFLEKKK